MWKKAEKYLSVDKKIGPLIKKYGPCKILPSKKKDYFSDLIEAIIGQQLSGQAANSIFNKLKNSLGGEVMPEKILRKRNSTLRKCGLSFAKIKYVKDLSKRVISNRLKMTSLRRLSDEEVIEELTQVKGIGRWTSEMFLMFTLARPDVFPVDDLGINKGLKLMFNKRTYNLVIGNKGLRWKPYRTVASWYLWNMVDDK
jgi:3-methyladenine DNA glycosylase/8-oxoguanine DNA glycosylase